MQAAKSYTCYPLPAAHCLLPNLPMSRFRPDLFAVLGFLLLPFVLFWPVTLGNRTLIPTDNLFFFEPWASVRDQFNAQPPEIPHNDLPLDLLLENYAWKKFITQSIHDGQLPLWNPYLFAGVPFLAAGQHSALYPFSLLFYVLPIPLAFGWFIVSQFFLAGLFTYIFLRALGQSRAAALAGGLIYEFSLFMVVSVTFPMIVAGAIWLPLILASVDSIIRQRPALGGRPASLPWVTVGALALGCQVLAGHPEVIYYTLLIAGSYAAVLLVQSTIQNPHSKIRNLIRPAAYLLTFVTLGLALGAVQLIPLAAVLPSNFRAGATAATLEEVRGWAYPTRHLLHFLIPNIFGNPAHHGYWDLFTGQWTPVTVNALGQPISKIDWGPPITNYVEGGAYVGILPLILAAFGILSIFTEYTSRKAFFAILALLSLAFAFGTPLYALVYYLPGLNQLHSPFRWVWPFSLCIAVLAGFGLDYLRHRQSALTTFALRLSFVFCLLSGLILIFALVYIYFNFANLQSPIANLLNDLALANTAFADARMFFSYEAVWIARLAGLLLASSLVLWLAARAHRLWIPLAITIIAIDLLSASAGFNSASETTILDYTPPVVEFLKQDTGLWRFTTYDPNGQKLFNANAGWFYNFQDVRGYDSIIPQQYADYLKLIEPQNELQFNRIAPVSNLQSLDSPLLDLLNVKYILTYADIPLPKYKLVYSDPGIKVYENLGVAARAFTLPEGCALAAANLNTALQKYDPRQYVILETEAPSYEYPPKASAESCQPIAADVIAYDGVDVSVHDGLTAKSAEITEVGS